MAGDRAMANVFEQFWTAYPRREKRKLAQAAFATAMTKTTIEVMLTALAWQCRQQQWTRERGRFIPLPTSWLNGERWDDEPFQAPPTQAPHVEHTPEWLALRDRMHGK